MDNQLKIWLYDILQCVEEVEGYFRFPDPLDASFLWDIKTKRAVERNLEIIGEAIHRIVRKYPDFYIENAHQIIGTRNRIAHGYDVISDEYLLDIIKYNLPALKKEVEHLMDEK